MSGSFRNESFFNFAKKTRRREKLSIIKRRRTLETINDRQKIAKDLFLADDELEEDELEKTSRTKNPSTTFYFGAFLVKDSTNLLTAGSGSSLELWGLKLLRKLNFNSQ